MKYKGKYSLVENLHKGRGMRLLNEMQIKPEEAKVLAQGILGARHITRQGNQRNRATGNAGELFIQQHLGGKNLNNVKPNFPFADIYTGNLGDLAKSEEGTVQGLVFYSVKAASQVGSLDIKIDLNPNDFCADMEKFGHIRPDQDDVFIRWGVYFLSVQGVSAGADAVMIRKFGPVTVHMKREGDDWIPVYVGKRPGRTLDQSGDVSSEGVPLWSGNPQVRGIRNLEAAMGITHEIVAESDPYTESKTNPGRRSNAGKDAYDPGSGGAGSSQPGFKGT